MSPMKSDKDAALMIARMAKEEVSSANPAKEARKAAIHKMMQAFKAEDVDSYMTAMDELKEIDS